MRHNNSLFPLPTSAIATAPHLQFSVRCSEMLDLLFRFPKLLETSVVVFFGLLTEFYHTNFISKTFQFNVNLVQ